MTSVRRIAVAVCIVAAVFCFGPGPSCQADTFEVLWYTGGTVATSGSSFPLNYNAGVLNLASTVPGNTGNTWNVTLWSGGAIPAAPMGGYDSLVTASPQGGWATNPSYTALLTAKTNATLPALGDRVMVTGQDADWHYMNFPGPVPFNGPKGFLSRAIDWASSGTGMGAVFLANPDSVLAAILGAGDFAALGTGAGSTNNVFIPASKSAYPINVGLTSAGLSNWSTSAHEIWTGTNSLVWEGINTDGASTTDFVTLVSAATGSGPIPGVPEPASLTMLATGVIGLFGSAWRRRKAAAK